MEAVETHKLSNGRTLEIYQDDNYCNPREDDNLGTMICFHRRYNLGDKHDYNSNDYSSWAEMQKAIEKNEKPAVILPLYLYDHSGITISTSPFSCHWDSGQIGFIFVSRERIKQEYKTKRITKTVKKFLENILLAEVNTYDQYLTGDVYGFKVIDENGNEEDSCWGFYGNDIKTNGILDHVQGELVG